MKSKQDGVLRNTLKPHRRKISKLPQDGNHRQQIQLKKLFSPSLALWAVSWACQVEVFWTLHNIFFFWEIRQKYAYQRVCASKLTDVYYNVIMHWSHTSQEYWWLCKAVFLQDGGTTNINCTTVQYSLV